MGAVIVGTDGERDVDGSADEGSDGSVSGAVDVDVIWLSVDGKFVVVEVEGKVGCVVGGIFVSFELFMLTFTVFFPSKDVSINCFIMRYSSRDIGK